MSGLMPNGKTCLSLCPSHISSHRRRLVQSRGPRAPSTQSMGVQKYRVQRYESWQKGALNPVPGILPEQPPGKQYPSQLAFDPAQKGGGTVDFLAVCRDFGLGIGQPIFELLGLLLSLGHGDFGGRSARITDHRTTDNGTTDCGTTDHRTTSCGTGDGRTRDNRTTDHWTTDSPEDGAADKE